MGRRLQVRNLSPSPASCNRLPSAQIGTIISNLSCLCLAVCTGSLSSSPSERSICRLRERLAQTTLQSLFATHIRPLAFCSDEREFSRASEDLCSPRLRSGSPLRPSGRVPLTASGRWRLILALAASDQSDRSGHFDKLLDGIGVDRIGSDPIGIGSHTVRSHQSIDRYETDARARVCDRQVHLYMRALLLVVVVVFVLFADSAPLCSLSLSMSSPLSDAVSFEFALDVCVFELSE